MSDIVAKIISGAVTTASWPASDLYKRYEIYVEESRAKQTEILTPRVFGLTIMKIPGVSKKSTNRYNQYSLDAASIKKHLVDNHEYDGDGDDE